MLAVLVVMARETMDQGYVGGLGSCFVGLEVLT
jgi:hypothetical protein